MRRLALLTADSYPSVQRHCSACLLTAFLLLITYHLLIITALHAQGITPQGIITTVAGTNWTFRGDGKAALEAPLGQLGGVAVDPAGNLYIADIGNQMVFRVSTAGVLTILAGNGIQWSSGDGGPGNQASVNSPSGVLVDAAGNILLSDTESHRIRKVTPAGVITTVAGTGEVGYSGDSGPATNAMLAFPIGLAMDAAGNLFIADLYNHRIRRVTPGGTITTVAGTGVDGFSGDGGLATSAQLSQPRGVAVGTDGSLYIADSTNFRVRKVSPSGIISTFAGDGVPRFGGDSGPATSASLNFPSGVALDAVGNLYIATTGSHRIRKVNLEGIISTVAGNGMNTFSGDSGPATSAALNDPMAVAVDGGGNFFIAELSNQRIRRVNSAGTITTVAGNGEFKFAGDGSAATSAALDLPFGVATDAAGNFYIADTQNHRVRRVNTSGVISTVAGTGVQGFSGDGGAATSAALDAPRGVALDASANLYIADRGNFRLRRVSPSGTITTVAGGGDNFPGDGGPATSAALSAFGVALDTAGNLYIADRANGRIRKVTPAGIITTVAGGGAAFPGDGGLATNATLNNPSGVAVDALGNLYIADTLNNRIRKVNAGGIITTFAGNGTFGFAGDGGPATAAMLTEPAGVALDAAGNVYIADYWNGRIRRVTLDGIIRTIAGGGSGEQFAGDGGPATSAAMNQPTSVAFDAVGSMYIADSGNDRIRKVLALPPSFAVSPSSLNFTAAAGAQVLPSQTVSVSSPIVGLPWSAVASTESGGGWLAVSPSAGSTPGTMDVFVNAASLGAGTYRGSVTVQAPLASPPSLSVAVTLTVQPAPAASLAVEPSSLTFEGNAGAGNPPAQTLRISNTGGGTLNWTAQATTTTGGNRLSLSSASGSASASAPATIEVSATIGSLAAGTYSGSVRIQSSTTNESIAVPVTLLVRPVAGSILLSQRGLTFTGVAGGSAVPSQNFGILNTGQGAMSWTAQATTLSGGGWLSVSPASGTSTAGSPQPPLVDVNVNVARLAAGQYSGLIRVASGSANNSPQFLTVTLSVLPPGANPGVLVRPTGLLFIRPAGSSSPGSQAVRLETAATGNVEAVVNPSTFSGGDWLNLAPRNLTVSSSDPRTITVQPSLGSLAAGEYFGALTLLFSDLTLQTVSVRFVVTPSGGTPSVSANLAAATDDGSGGEPAAGLSGAAVDGCTPQRLYIAGQSLGGNFSIPTGFPSTIQVLVRDDCDNGVADAIVAASFDNGDASLPLAGIGNGVYQGSWQPGNSGRQNSTGPVRVTVRASRTPSSPSELPVDGQILNNSFVVPALNAGGIVNAASSAAGEPLAPGSIVSVYGSNLANNAVLASVLPLPTSLGSATLNIAGSDVPLFYSSSGQINAQLPFDLPANSRPHVYVRVQRSGSSVETASVPETITVAAARPAIFTVNQQGTGQGAILNQNSSPNSPSNPESRGRVVQIFATGLGATNPVVPPGQSSPANPPANTVLLVTAQIGDQPATVQFAGLAPNYVGLYQVNVLVPASAPTGSAVPLVLTQDGVPSNTVTLAIQ
ncbi:MAG: hypothetical protein HY316_04025 [Acidobacteria bacterium]|nr:hypothetical protein [Acidobacteriota bacterium]